MKKLQWTRALIITFSWALLGIFQTFYDHLFLKSHFISESSEQYEFVAVLISNFLFGLFGGFIGGMVLIFVDERYRTRPYIYTVSIIVFFFLAITGTITVLYSLVLSSLAFPLFSDGWINNFELLVYTSMHLKNLLFWGSTVAITYFFLQMSNKFGPGILFKILIGKYNIPKTENRIFMFLDLKSSTSIAEKLGSEKYHEFLKDVFSDITAAIINSGGEIYQYVGDEVVISWKAGEKLKNNDSIRCYFEIQTSIAKLSSKYLDKYAQIPEFKAGAHYGAVVAGEIGVIKRDITYSGDTLNTCARIQAECNNLNSKFLISNDLFQLIKNISSEYSFLKKGAINLRGKELPLNLVAVSE
ncbi:MAG: adenylate/guanylate cyclase domain-containing protein [Cytophagales bacterium]